MPRVFLFATIGGALVVICWMTIRLLVNTVRKKNLQRVILQDTENRIREAASEPGGGPGNPITIDTPSVVESRASSIPCPKCEGTVKVLEHQAKTIDGIRLRIAIVRCSMCGFERKIFFHISNND